MYDLFSPTFKSDPFPTYAKMREDDPIYKHVSPNGRVVWYITRHEEATAVFRDDYHFCKDPRHAGAQHGRRTQINRLINENMLFSDGAVHKRLRGLVNQAFTPRRIAAIEPSIQKLADDLLAAIPADAPFDLIADYALPIPVIVICDLLGFPAADREQVTAWSNAIIAPRQHGLTRKERRHEVKAFVTYLQAMFADRRAVPQDDLITGLVQAGEQGDRLNEEELSSMVAMLLVTGHETTVNLIGNGTLSLLRHPEALRRIMAGEAGWEEAIEELLRYDGPVESSTTRWVREDMEFHGHAFKQGDLIRIILSSANRDNAQFIDPDSFDLDRRDGKKHLAFGHGKHHCLGAPLARLEGRVALETLFRKRPSLHLAIPESQLEWNTGVLFRGLKTLPLR